MKKNNILNSKRLYEFIKNPEIYKFVLVGAGAAVSVFSLTVFFTSYLGIFYVISVAIAFEITLIWGFFAHDRWTFARYPKESKTIVRFIKYNSVSLIALGINELILVFLTTQIELHYTTSEAIAIIGTFVYNYIINKKISFKR